MCAYTCRYRHFRLTAISSQMRLISIHTRLSSDHASIVSTQKSQWPILQSSPSRYKAWSHPQMYQWWIDCATHPHANAHHIAIFLWNPAQWTAYCQAYSIRRAVHMGRGNNIQLAARDGFIPVFTPCRFHCNTDTVDYLWQCTWEHACDLAKASLKGCLKAYLRAITREPQIRMYRVFHTQHLADSKPQVCVSVGQYKARSQ